jgi:hypothetical protein
VSVIEGQRDPPETATPELDEDVTGVVEDPKPDEVEVDEDEVELEVEVDVEVEVVVLADAEVVVPGIVFALTALSTPTPATAAKATPAVSRLRRRMAASRARTLDCVVLSMAESVAAASESSLRES